MFQLPFNETFRIPFFSNLSEIILEHARQYQRFVDQKLLLYENST